MFGIILAFLPIDIVDNVELQSNAESINETDLNKLTYKKLNDERSKRDLNRLEKREDIEEIAIYKTDRMISENYISHTAPDGEEVRDRFELFDVECKLVGENLAKTFYNTKVDTGYEGTVTYQSMEELSTGITKQFMNSPSHKDNILDERWESHGISVQVTSDNEVYATHKFCQV
jgi:uncharacterized protein YkwD